MKNRRQFFYGKTMNGLIILLTLLCSTSLLFAEDALLSWDASPDTDVVGYKLYSATASGQYEFDNAVDVGDTTSHTLLELSPGVHYFSLTAYDSSGNQSAFSNEVSKEISGNASAPSGGGGGGGGGCAIRFPLNSGSSPLDAAEMLAIVAAVFFLAARRAVRSLPFFRAGR